MLLKSISVTTKYHIWVKNQARDGSLYQRHLSSSDCQTKLAKRRDHRTRDTFLGNQTTDLRDWRNHIFGGGIQFFTRAEHNRFGGTGDQSAFHMRLLEITRAEIKL
jgi:hypothetical protein